MSVYGSFVMDDDASSIYSRPPDASKRAQDARALPVPTRHDLPEINPLDHQICLARGSTIALETTRARLQCAKDNRRLSLPETLNEKRRQWECQEHENRFFEVCLGIFDDLSTVAIDVSQALSLRYEFEPETNPVRNEHLREAIEKLRLALQRSREREARAESEWKRQWNLPPSRGPFCRWI